MPLSTVDPTPALIVVDLQQSVLALGVPGTSEVLARSVRLLDAFRAAGHPVVLVNVDASPGGRSDQNPAGGGARMTAEQLVLAPELGQRADDLGAETLVGPKAHQVDERVGLGGAQSGAGQGAQAGGEDVAGARAPGLGEGALEDCQDAIGHDVGVAATGI